MRIQLGGSAVLARWQVSIFRRLAYDTELTWQVGSFARWQVSILRVLTYNTKISTKVRMWSDSKVHSPNKVGTRFFPIYLEFLSCRDLVFSSILDVFLNLYLKYGPQELYFQIWSSGTAILISWWSSGVVFQISWAPLEIVFLSVPLQADTGQ